MSDGKFFKFKMKTGTNKMTNLIGLWTVLGLILMIERASDPIPRVEARLMECPVPGGLMPEEVDLDTCTECTECYNYALTYPDFVGYYEFIDIVGRYGTAVDDNIRKYDYVEDPDFPNESWTSWAEAPSENHFACGIDAISRDWDYDGVSGMRIKWCHILGWRPGPSDSWDTEEIGLMYPTDTVREMSECQINAYIDTFSIQWDLLDDNGSQDTGVAQIQYRCTEPEKKACTTDNAWVTPDVVISNTNPKEWTPIIFGDHNEYICGFRLKSGQQWNWKTMSNVDLLGMYDLAVRFCDNRFENVGFRKDGAVVTSTYPGVYYNYAHNPFKTNVYNMDYTVPSTTCIFTDNSRIGGDYWSVQLDAGPVRVYSVSILTATSPWDGWLNGVEIYVGDTLCATISDAPSGEWFGIACDGEGATIKLQQAPGGYLGFCGIMVWKEIAATPTGYPDIPLSYSVRDPDLALSYPGLNYEDMVTHTPRKDIDDITPGLDYKFVVVPYDDVLNTSPLSLKIGDFLSLESCFPVCSKMQVQMCADSSCATPITPDSEPVSLDSSIDTSEADIHGYSLPNMQFYRQEGRAVYSSVAYLEFTAQGCFPKSEVAKIKVILCGTEQINEIIPEEDKTIFKITPPPEAAGPDLTHRILFEDIFNITQDGNIDAAEVDCPFKEFKLCLDEECTEPVEEDGTDTQKDRYTIVTSGDLELGYDLDIQTEFGPEILYACAFSYGNVKRSVEMSHQVIQRNDYHPDFAEGEWHQIYKVWENQDPQTFEWTFPCITDQDILDTVWATYEDEDVPTFGRLEELPDPDCQYGTRWKASFVGVTTEHLGTYEIPITLTDEWNHTSYFTLTVEIQLEDTYKSGFDGASFSQVYQVAEWQDPQTFIYEFPCITDVDTGIDDTVTATFGELPVFGELEEIEDPTCQYGTRYKVTFADITTKDIGIYEIGITLTDRQLHESEYILTIHIQELKIWELIGQEDPNPPSTGEVITWNQTTSAYIERITCSGKLSIRFNRTMSAPLEALNSTYYRQWLAEFNETILDIYVVPDEQQLTTGEEQSLRFLQQEQEASDNETEQSIIDNRFNLTWNVTSFVDNLMVIDLNFTNSSAVSAAPSAIDDLVFHIRNNKSNIPRYFVSEDGFPLVNVTLTSGIPQQACPDDMLNQMTTFGVAVAQSMKVLLMLVIVVRVTGGGSLWQFLTVIQTLQLIVHLGLFNVAFPENVVQYLNGLSPIMTYDIFFTNQWMDTDTTSTEYDPSIDSAFWQMQYMGYYNRENPLQNLFSLAIVVAFYYAALFATFLVLGPLKKIASKSQCLTLNAKKAAELLMFDFIVFVTMVCYLEMMIAGILVYQKQTQQFDFGNVENHPLQLQEERMNDTDYYFGYTPEEEQPTDIVDNQSWRRNLFELQDRGIEEIQSGPLLMALYFLLSTMILLPALFLYIISRKMQYYNEESFVGKWGASFYDIKTKSPTYTRIHIMYILFYILRRALFLLVVFSVSEFICLQIILALPIAAFMIWYKQTYKPFNSKYRNCCKTFNEVIIFLATENLIFFTDYMCTWDHHWGAGWVFIYIISIWMLIHTLVMLEHVLIWLYLIYLRYKPYCKVFDPCTNKINACWIGFKSLPGKCWRQVASLCEEIEEEEEVEVEAGTEPAVQNKGEEDHHHHHHKKKKRIVIKKKKKKKIIKRRTGWQNPLVFDKAMLTWERQPQYYDWEEELVLNGRREWYQGKRIVSNRKVFKSKDFKGWQNPLIRRRVMTWERQPQCHKWEEELILNGRRQWHQGKLINYRVVRVWRQRRQLHTYLHKYWQNPLVAQAPAIQWERQPRYYKWEEEVMRNGVREWYQGKLIKHNQFGGYRPLYKQRTIKMDIQAETVKVKRKGWQNPLQEAFRVIDFQRPSTRVANHQPAHSIQVVTLDVKDDFAMKYAGHKDNELSLDYSQPRLHSAAGARKQRQMRDRVDHTSKLQSLQQPLFGDEPGQGEDDNFMKGYHQEVRTLAIDYPQRNAHSSAAPRRPKKQAYYHQEEPEQPKAQQINSNILQSNTGTTDQVLDKMRRQIIESTMSDLEKKQALNVLFERMSDPRKSQQQLAIVANDSKYTRRAASAGRQARLAPWNVKERLNQDLNLSRIEELGLESSRFEATTPNYRSDAEPDAGYVTIKVRKSQLHKQF